MTGSPRYTLDVALIASRAAELGWDEATFIAEVGVHLRDLARVLRADRVTVAWLGEIADALGLHPADLIRTGGAGVTGGHADADVLEAVLMPRNRPAPVSGETLSVLLGWPMARVEAAMDALGQRLEQTAVRVIHDQGGYVIASRAPSAHVWNGLPGMRQRANPLTLDHAAQVLSLLRSALASRTCEHASSPAPAAEPLPAGPAVCDSDGPPDRVDHLGVHPDLLFALLLVDKPAHDGRAGTARRGLA